MWKQKDSFSSDEFHSDSEECAKSDLVHLCRRDTWHEAAAAQVMEQVIK